MISLYSGSPGSGKSLHAAKDIRMYLASGRPLIVNFGINPVGIKQFKDNFITMKRNNELTCDFLREYSFRYSQFKNVDHLKEGSILLVIDEAQLIFNNRSWNAIDRQDWISFFTQHRKLGFEIIMICQMKEMIDKQIRGLIEYEWIHRKVGNIGRSGKLISILGGGGMHVAIKTYAQMRNLQVDRIFYKYSAELSSLYNSYDLFD